MATRRKEAFFGATSHDFPVLGAGYVQYLFERLHRTSDTLLLPSQAAAIEGVQRAAQSTGGPHDRFTDPQSC